MDGAVERSALPCTESSPALLLRTVEHQAMRAKLQLVIGPGTCFSGASLYLVVSASRRCSLPVLWNIFRRQSFGAICVLGRLTRSDQFLWAKSLPSSGYFTGPQTLILMDLRVRLTAAGGRKMSRLGFLLWRNSDCHFGRKVRVVTRATLIASP